MAYYYVKKYPLNLRAIVNYRYERMSHLNRILHFLLPVFSIHINLESVSP